MLLVAALFAPSPAPAAAFLVAAPPSIQTGYQQYRAGIVSVEYLPMNMNRL